jgi:DNA repair exonuclease SbcCD nuclease subunit
MASLEFICIGDLHISGLNNLFPNYSFDPNHLIYKALKVPLSYAKENGIKVIIFGGDIFHNPDPSQQEQREFIDFLRKHNKFKFYAIAGNHDYSNTEKISLEISKFTSEISNNLDHVKFFIKPELMKIEGIPFSFLPWPHHKTLERPSVNIAHVEVTGSIADNGKILEDGYKISNSGLWYVGHLHRIQEIGRANYPGTLYQRTFAEPLLKGFFHVKLEYNKGELSGEHEFVTVDPVYKLITLKISDVDELKQVKKPDSDNIKQYLLLMKNGVEIPAGFLEDFPNVIDVRGKLSIKEINQLEQDGFSMQDTSSSVDILEGLEDFLLNDGLDKSEVKTAKRYIKSFIEELRIST